MHKPRNVSQCLPGSPSCFRLTKRFLRQGNKRVGRSPARMLGNLLQEPTALDVTERSALTDSSMPPESARSVSQRRSQPTVAAGRPPRGITAGPWPQRGAGCKSSLLPSQQIPAGLGNDTCEMHPPGVVPDVTHACEEVKHLQTEPGGSGLSPYLKKEHLSHKSPQAGS